jgi:hypothetical protein
VLWKKCLNLHTVSEIMKLQFGTDNLIKKKRKNLFRIYKWIMFLFVTKFALLFISWIFTVYFIVYIFNLLSCHRWSGFSHGNRHSIKRHWFPRVSQWKIFPIKCGMTKSKISTDFWIIIDSKNALIEYIFPYIHIQYTNHKRLDCSSRL